MPKKFNFKSFLSTSIILTLLISGFLAFAKTEVLAQVSLPNQLGNISWIEKIEKSFTNGWQTFYLLLPGDKSGELVLAKMFERMENIETVYLQTDATMSVKDVTQAQDFPLLSFSTQGPLVRYAEGQGSVWKQDLHLVSKLYIDGLPQTAEADLKIDNGAFYFRINDLPEALFLPLNQARGQWLVTSTILNSELSDSPNPISNHQLAEMFADLELSQAERTMYQSKPVFKVKTKITPTFINKHQELLSQSLMLDPTLFRFFLLFIQDQPITLFIDSSDYSLAGVSVPIESLVSDLEAESFQEFLSVLQAPVTVSPGTVISLDLELGLSFLDQPVEFSIPERVREAQTVLDELLSQNPLLMPNFLSPQVGRVQGAFSPEDFQAKGILDEVSGDQVLDQAVAQGAPAKKISSSPIELKKLTTSQKELLKDYGVEVVQ